MHYQDLLILKKNCGSSDTIAVFWKVVVTSEQGQLLIVNKVLSFST